MALTYRLCVEGDEEGLARFYQEVSGSFIDPAFWKWKYFENPSGPPCIALALDGERIVGRIGFVPLRFRVDSDDVMAAHQVDSDILENYRKGGTFFHLGRMVKREGECRNLAFGLGFSIEATKDISIKTLGFSLVAPIGRVVKVIDPTQYLDRKVKIPGMPVLGRNIRRYLKWREERLSSGDADVYEISNFDGNFDDLWEKAKLARVMVAKDSKYLNWRYFKCPAVKYRVYATGKKEMLKGFIVFRIEKDKGIAYGIIDDIVCIPNTPGIMEKLVSAAVRYLINQGAESIICWIPYNHCLYPVLRKKGFIKRPIPHYLIVVPNKDKDMPLALLKDEKNWFYMLGDSDYRLIHRDMGKVLQTR